MPEVQRFDILYRKRKKEKKKKKKHKHKKEDRKEDENTRLGLQDCIIMLYRYIPSVKVYSSIPRNVQISLYFSPAFFFEFWGALAQATIPFFLL